MIENYFPTSFYIEKNLLDDVYCSSLISKCEQIKKEQPSQKTGWRCPTYTSSFNLLEIHDFHPLLNEMHKHVNLFAEQLGSKYDYKELDAWFNVYGKGDYQEFHYHIERRLSAVYCLQTTDEMPALTFRNPLEPEMLPLKNLQRHNESIGFKLPQNTLIIFRSYVEHMVEEVKTEGQRITFAVNY